MILLYLIQVYINKTGLQSADSGVLTKMHFNSHISYALVLICLVCEHLKKNTHNQKAAGLNRGPYFGRWTRPIHSKGPIMDLNYN